MGDTYARARAVSAGRDVGRNDDHPGRDVGDRDTVRRIVRASATRPHLAPDGRSMGLRAADIRAAANLGRALEPPAVRRSILELSKAIGWPPSEVERLTLGDVIYLKRQADEARAHAAAVRAYRGARR